MKKFATAAIATTVAIGVAVPALAVNAAQTVDVKVTPSKAGTKAKPASVKLKVTTGTTPAADDPAFATKKAVIFFDKNLSFTGTSKFKSCTAAQVQQAESGCPSGSKVGGGTATGKALGQTQNLKVSAFNAAKGKKLLLHVTGSSPLQIDSVITATLSKASGKYGQKLTVPIPENLQQPVPGVFATLTEFITSVSGKAGGKPYAGLTGCTGGKLNFKGTFSFTDGTSKTATSTAKCSK